MSMIDYLEARQVFDFSGNSAIEVDCFLEDGSFGRASASGVKNIEKALKCVNETLDSQLESMDSLDQVAVDSALQNLKQKPEIGVTLCVSMAVARAAADFLGISLRERLGSFCCNVLPKPVLSNGKELLMSKNGSTFLECVTDILTAKEVSLVPNGKFKNNTVEFSTYPTLTQAFNACSAIRHSGNPVVLSCLENPTEDSFAADFCVALSCDFAVFSSKNTVLLNQFLRLEDEISK